MEPLLAGALTFYPRYRWNNVTLRNNAVVQITRGGTHCFVSVHQYAPHTPAYYHNTVSVQHSHWVSSRTIIPLVVVCCLHWPREFIQTHDVHLVWTVLIHLLYFRHRVLGYSSINVQFVVNNDWGMYTSGQPATCRRHTDFVMRFTSIISPRGIRSLGPRDPRDRNPPT